MTILIPILKLVLTSGLLYSYYHLFLRNRRFHNYNRFYLLGALLLSVVIPFLAIPVDFLWQGRPPAAALRTLRIISADGWEEPVTIYAGAAHLQQWFSPGRIIFAVYTIGLVVTMLAMLSSLNRIYLLKKRYRYETVNGVKLYHTTAPGTPFSFFSSIFWDNRLSLAEEKGQQIFRHELFHVKEKHSLDVLVMEVACCCCWFNPFFHLMRKELKAIHEFLADQYAASASNTQEYAELLVLHAIKQKKLQFTTPFFHNQLKRRIKMITQSNIVRRHGYISRLMALPLLFILVTSFAGRLQPGGKNNIAHRGKTITVVIDPGHGGMYPGGHGNALVEKDLNLQISQKIKELSSAYNINVTLTRSTDQQVGNANNLQDDLKNRVSVATATHADLFLSIHINADVKEPSAKTGFDVYVSSKKVSPATTGLASALLTKLKDVYTTNEVIQSRQTGVFVLDKTDCPAVIVECGYITNEADAAFISSSANQDKVAKKILEGIVQYANTQTSSASAATAPAEPSLGSTLTEQSPGLLQDTDKIEPLQKTEEEADYPGGSDGWVKYLIKTVQYPPAALKKNLQGTVVLEFVIDRQGKVSDVRAISGPEEFKAESIRVIKESGRWIPAKEHGKPVTSHKRQPITYRLS